MAKDIEKECPCKAAEELSAEDVENVAGGASGPIRPVISGAEDQRGREYDKVVPKSANEVKDYMGQYN
ncbi:MAG: hypothetical protein HUJ65_04960 [Oscillospiraceae bacterium]|nr:hypothetical protein [Oscillospiraceae bacterium]